MISEICALYLSGASFVLPTECAVDPASRTAVHYETFDAKPPKPKPVKRPRPRVIDHSKPSPASRNMAVIPPGSFMMGSPDDEVRRDNNEGPRHKVEIDYTFEIGKYEITFNDWRKCVAGGGCRGYRPKDGGWGRGNRPAIFISWNDAQSYIKWLNRTTGYRYRLPTEAEWEYVARGQTKQPFSTGTSISAAQANFNGEHPYGDAPKGQYRRKTLPVGSFAANKFGVYDIHGNVYEWVQDCWNPSHVGAPVNGSARTDGDCKFRIMRGGSWVTHGYQMRASKRLRYTTDYRYDDYGFRLARTIEK